MRVATITLLGALTIGFLAAGAAAQEAPVKKKLAKRIKRKLAGKGSRVAISPCNKWVAASDLKGAVVLFSTEDETRKELVDPADYVSAMRFTADSAFLVVMPFVMKKRERIHVYDVAQGKKTHTIYTDDAPEANPMGVRHFAPGQEGPTMLLVRDSGLEIWDFSKGEMAESLGNSLDAWRYAACQKAGLVASGNYKGISVRDAATGQEKFLITERDDSKKKKKKKKAIDLGRTNQLVGFTTAGDFLIVRSRSETVTDPNKLKNPNLDPKKRLAAIKKKQWIEAFRVADGKSAWTVKIAERTYYQHVLPGDGVIGLLEKDKLRFLKPESGASKGRTSSTKKISGAAVSDDGTTFWVVTKDGYVLRAR